MRRFATECRMRIPRWRCFRPYPNRPCCEPLGWAALLVLGFGLWAACQELNPYFDPDGGPPCVAGERQCGASGLDIEICTQDATGFAPLRSCFVATHCSEGVCLPDAPATPCARADDCAAAGQVCSVAVGALDPPALTTVCLPAPVPGGRPGGQACASHGECQSGWCFRRVCFEACQDASDCTNPQHECARLDVTVDGVRDAIHVQGCAPAQ